MMKKLFLKTTFITSTILTGLLISQPAMAGKFKCWTNDEGVKECGSYVPPKYSQKKIETRGNSGRITEVEDRAKTKVELEEIERQAKLKAIEDAKIAEQKKKDDILLKTFSNERDINLLRDSKINVIEGIIIVTNSNNKALQKKLEKLQKKAANTERRGKKPAKNILDDIAIIQTRLKNNNDSIKLKRDEQIVIKAKFKKDLERFNYLKGKNKATK